MYRVMDFLSLREYHARALLIYYRWDVVKLFSIIGDNGLATVCSKVGLRVTENSAPGASLPSSVRCDICMEDDLPYSSTSIMDCCHCFCNDCKCFTGVFQPGSIGLNFTSYCCTGWTEHFRVKIDEGQSKNIRCMSDECNVVCDEAVVSRLLSKRHPSLVKKFKHQLLESYIVDNKMVKWCPSIPHCGNAIRIKEEDDEVCEVECSCGLQFCFNCLEEIHSPCSCLMWKLWKQKCQD